MIIVLSPLMLQDEYSPLWAPRKKDKDRLFPLWYPGDLEYHPEQVKDVHVIFYSTSVCKESPGKVQLVDNEIIVFTDCKSPSFQWVFRQAENFIKERFVAGRLFHIPANYFVLLRGLSDYSTAPAESLTSVNSLTPFYAHLAGDESCLYPIETCLLCEDITPDRDRHVCFSINPEIDTEKLTQLKAIELLEGGLADHKIQKEKYSLEQPEMPHLEMISLGGWCGPAEALRNLKIRKQALPFDYIHSSMEGINLMFDGQESAYFPSSGETRSRYAIYPHHDLQDADTVKSIKKRFSRLWQLLAEDKPVLFIRTVINPDFRQELEQAKIFIEILKNKYQRTRDRLVLIFHDQKVGTVQLDPLAENIMCWSAQGKVGWHIPNRNDISCSYMKIVSFAMEEENWPPKLQIRNHKLLDHSANEIYKTLFDERPVERPELAINWSANCVTQFIPRTAGYKPAAILVAGCPHSGTNLLDSVLNSHPKICSISGLVTTSNEKHSGSKTCSLERLYDEQINRLTDNCNYWCESSPENIFYIEKILQSLGKEARIINIIRDGRDVAVSEVGHLSWKARVSPECWLDYVIAGNKYAKHPQVLCIKYEDLVRNYEAVVKELCEFLKLEPVDEMMKYREAIMLQESGEWYTNSKVCDDCSSIGSWQNDSANSLVFKFLEWPGVVSALELYGYIPRKRFIFLRRVKRTIRRWIKSIWKTG